MPSPVHDEIKGILQGIAMIAHDLKSPLASILANAEFVRGGAPPEAAADAMTDIVDAARIAERAMANLLDVCSREEGTLVPSRMDVDVALLLEGVRRLAARRAGRQQQALVVVTDLGAGGTISADEELLRRVVENLVDNAIKYTPWKGTIQITATRLAGIGVEFSVRDEGPGIPENLRERIFESYVRLDRDALREVGASRGLGLAFCRAAVEAHGGRIRAVTRQPTGSDFRFTLPA